MMVEQEETLKCENSIYLNKSWKLVNDYDFTMILFLKDHNESSNFDDMFECYGGKLEFPNHQFGFNPERGTAIIFPSNHYFLNKTNTPTYGDLFQVRLHFICTERFKYNPDNFKGNYLTWFKDLT